MNFARSLFAPTLVLALALGATACKKDKPDGTNPPDGNTGGNVAGSDGGGSADGGSAGGGEGGGADGGGGEGGGGEKPKTCEAKTADTPTTLFGEQVFIRPPVNVTLAEENPTMAVGHVSGGFVSACEATIDRMTLLVFEHDAKKKQTPKDFAIDFIDHYLAKGGYTGGTKSDPVVDNKTDYDLAVEYPAAGGQPASVLYIAVKQRHKNFFTIVYQTRPDEYPLLKPTFTASANTLLVKPPS